MSDAKASRPLARALSLFLSRYKASETKGYDYKVEAPKLAPGVVPTGTVAPVMASDAASIYEFAAASYPGGGFPGYSYLAQLATRPEYRAFAAALSTEITREWIKFTSKQDDDTSTKDKIKQIEEAFETLNVKGIFERAVQHDVFFGRAQIFLKLNGQDKSTPLILDKRTVPQGSLHSISTVEAMWTTPSAYNALDPSAPDFYCPSSWFMLGQPVHASRLLTVITRPVPDMLKPAFNFSGISLSQLAEPYVDNWLRTRQSVSDLINNFSITALATSMDQVLEGDEDAASELFSRADLFTATRSNRGLMLLDKEREELIQVNTPLSGLHELQAQSQEHMCSVSRMPAIVLTGISPSGLNASSDGEIRTFYDWIAAQQSAHWSDPLRTILRVVQLSLFGEIDPDIGFEWNPLQQMTPTEQADIRVKDSQVDQAYVDMGVLSPAEVRERIARSPESPYGGIDVDAVPELPDPGLTETPPEGLEGAVDGWEEGKHPRAENGQFGSGGEHDGAVVNVPLSKRGNIDAELDRWKKQQADIAAKKRKATAQETRENKALAKALIAEHQPAMLARFGEKFGEKELKHMFDQWAKWEPEKMIKFAEKFIQEESAK